jgi:hypothetical protein
LGRRILARTLSGGVAVVAALTMPELSVGAGDLGGGKALDDPPEPPSATGQDRAKRGSGAAKGRLAGVRYGALLEVSPGPSSAASLSRITNLDPAAISRDDIFPETHQLAELTAARPAMAPPPSVGTKARPIEAGRPSPTAADQLDRAAAFAASVLTDFTAPPGLPVDTARVPRAPLANQATNSLDQAASYSASVIENFVEQIERRPAMSAAAPAFDGGGLPTAGLAPAPAPAPSAPQAIAAPALAVPPTIPPASTPLQAVPAGLGDPVSAAPPPARTAAATLPARAPIAAASAAPSGVVRSIDAPATAPAPAPRAVAAPSAPVPAPPAAAVVVPKPKPALTAPASAAASPYEVDVSARLLTRVDGKTAGTVDFQQTPSGLKVRLGSIVEVLADRFDPAQIARIRCSAAGNTYLSLTDLQAQGVPISYDPVYDEFNVGTTDTRPKAGRKVHIDQITAPERSGDSTAIGQIRPRPC